MKELILCIILLCLTALSFCQELDNPTSIAIYSRPLGDYLYVSNLGDGSIRKYSNQSYIYFYQGLNGVRGILVYEHFLYAVSDMGLSIFDLNTQSHIVDVPIPGAFIPNDVVADSSGNIYISDNPANKIFKYVIASGEVNTFISEGIQNPTGMVFDEANNRLLIVSSITNSPIQAIQLPGGEISTITETTIGSLQGIGIDERGAIYFSSLETGSIYRMKDVYDAPTPIWTGLSGPADFFLREETAHSANIFFSTHQVYVPNTYDNSVFQTDLPNFITNFEINRTMGGEGGNSWSYVDWTTEHETQLMGYNLYYCNDWETPLFSEAVQFNSALIPATNTANHHHYHFDMDPFPSWNWWLETIEMDGTSHMLGPVQTLNVENNDNVVSPVLTNVNIYPNPVRVSSKLTYQTNKEQKLSIYFFDMKGRKLCCESGVFPAGKHEVSLSSIGFDTSILPAGVYFCRLKSENGQITKKLILTSK